MKSPLKKAMFHLAWSPDSLPTTDAISPLLEYLDSHLLALNSALLPRNFEKVLCNIWEICLLELSHQTDGSVGDKLAGFYDRLYEALDLLIEFFYADGKGLSFDILTGGNVTEKLISSLKKKKKVDNGINLSLIFLLCIVFHLVIEFR